MPSSINLSGSSFYAYHTFTTICVLRQPCHLTFACSLGKTAIDPANYSNGKPHSSVAAAHLVVSPNFQVLKGYNLGQAQLAQPLSLGSLNKD